MPQKRDGKRALTSAEKVRNFRVRRSQAGLMELRGVFVPTELHAQAKRILFEWLQSMTPKI